MTRQLLLSLRDYDRAQLAASRVRAVARGVIADVGPKVLAADWGLPSETRVSDKAEQRDRHYLKLDELVDLVLRDRSGRILAELCDVAGYDPPEPKRVLEPSEKLTRLDAAIDETVGPEVAGLIRKKAGIE